MEALSNLVLRTDSVEVPVEGGTSSLKLRGLSADAIAFMAQFHGEALGAVYTRAVQGGIDATNVVAALDELLSEAPILAATAIAFAADEPDAIEQAAALPLGTQIEALEKIFRLTFEGESAPKAWAIVRNLAETIAAKLNLRETSEAGSTRSERS